MRLLLLVGRVLSAPLFLVLCLAAVPSCAHLVQVIQLSRHGDRAPITMLPKVLDDPSVWPLGLGQLTGRGMWQTWQLGLQRRSRYIDSGFLRAEYSYQEVFARSTDVDRCLMSAQSQLFGMFPPGTGPQNQVNPLNSIPDRFQPIPIHTMLIHDDFLLRPFSNCPEYLRLRSDVVEKSELWQEKEKENGDFIKFVGDMFGYPDNTLRQTGWIYDTVFASHVHGMPLPPPLLEDDNLDRLIELGNWVLGQDFASPTVLPYLATPFLQEVKRRFQEAAGLQQPTSQVFKFILFAAHDTTVMPAAVALEAISPSIPPYAAHLDVELHAVDTRTPESFYVRIFYNDTLIQPSFCGTADCPLSDFLSFVDTFSLPNWQQACGTTSPDEPNPAATHLTTLNLVLIAVASVLLAAWIVFATVFWARKCAIKRQLRAASYGHLQEVAGDSNL